MGYGVELEVRREREQHMRWRRHTSRVSWIKHGSFSIRVKINSLILENKNVLKYFKGLYTLCLGTYTCKNKNKNQFSDMEQKLNRCMWPQGEISDNKNSYLKQKLN